MAEPLTIATREGVDLASVMARKGVTAAKLGEAIGLVVAEGPRVSSGEDLALIGTGPGTWLALGAAGLAARLPAKLGALASISDQSGAYTIFRLSGLDARTILQRGVAVDLHSGVFTVGSVATTLIAHIGVIVWQIDDLPAYDVAVFRSYTDSFRRWLDQATAAL